MSDFDEDQITLGDDVEDDSESENSESDGQVEKMAKRATKIGN